MTIVALIHVMLLHVITMPCDGGDVMIIPSLLFVDLTHPLRRFEKSCRFTISCFLVASV